MAKAYAFHVVLEDMSAHLQKPAYQLLGKPPDKWIAERLELKGGGHPSERAVRSAVARCKQPGWYPGAEAGKSTGRPPAYTEAQKRQVASAAMSLKRDLIRPTPQSVRAKVPRRSLNPETGCPMSKNTVYRIFRSHCFDETEDDPWVFMPTLSKDYLPTAMKPRRAQMAKHILNTFSAKSWTNTIAIDPCSSLLPRNEAKSEEQRVAAMGKSRFMSKKSRGKGVNLRAPAGAKSQGGGNVLTVHWTPIFARGQVRIYICDPVAAQRDPTVPAKLNDSMELAKFIKHALPQELDRMRAQHGWTTLPRVVVHDKGSYMVNIKAETLNDSFSKALRAGGFRSWAGDDASWMAARFGDVYPHETCIAHIRRLLEQKFTRQNPGETLAQFRRRMAKVEQHLNSDEFAAERGGGLMALNQEMRQRCEDVVARKGDRLPK